MYCSKLFEIRNKDTSFTGRTLGTTDSEEHLLRAAQDLYIWRLEVLAFFTLPPSKD
jgi:hypothetical protein